MKLSARIANPVGVRLFHHQNDVTQLSTLQQIGTDWIGIERIKIPIKFRMSENSFFLCYKKNFRNKFSIVRAEK
jgi:hypothetical protein